MKKISLLFLVFLVSEGYSQTGDFGSFQPLPKGKYLVSGWVKEEHAQQKITYNSSIIVSLESTSVANPPPLIFHPSGNIIDGWQRIVGILEIPENDFVDGYISIELSCQSEGEANCYFDDIRFLPYNGNLKSFVYDSDNSKLMAELDENNYATFYEYDPEGGLIRVKKETEKGVMTIQETRSSNQK